MTHPNVLACKGESAGAMVAAHAVNLYPEYFRACILNNPFLDVLSCLLDESLPLTATDHLELGNPIKDKDAYSLIHSLSPYENIHNIEYPAMLLTIAENDQRVPFWSALKYIEKIRDLAKEPKRIPNFYEKNIFARIRKDGGHFGSANNDENLNLAI